ncbi:hypothetical protein CRG98_022662 [Punica granatum]|uniref:Uncharacterized protein n=1 Tax=Punica granatum TaxID=22663 RepID=A0A2I0JL25_PUNGR|nr:hypothetical protein CRG98_022662 [Punica granatum]
MEWYGNSQTKATAWRSERSFDPNRPDDRAWQTKGVIKPSPNTMGSKLGSNLKTRARVRSSLERRAPARLVKPAPCYERGRHGYETSHPCTGQVGPKAQRHRPGPGIQIPALTWPIAIPNGDELQGNELHETS